MLCVDFDGIYNGLKETHGEVKPALEFSNVFELLIAVILSAQCTDKRVNIVTNELFNVCNTPKAFVDISEEELERYIRTCGLSKSKARHIKEACQKIVDEYNGIVPNTREELMTLSGVGRKTANVVLAVGYGKNAIAVDTHVFRVSNRIGLADAKNVEKTELQLMENIPEEKWSECHHLLIYHGRKVCKAQKPACEECKINKFCKYYLMKKNLNENKDR